MMCCTAHLCQAKTGHTCAQDTEQIHGKHGSGAPLSSSPLILVVLAEHCGCLSSADRDRELRIWNEREARRHECETRCWLTLERVRNSLLESFRSRRFSLLAGLDEKVTIWTDPLTLNPWLWRANRLNHNGRCSASFAATCECSDESECCTWGSVGWSAEHCTRSCRIAWINYDRAESFTSTDEEDARRSERLGKAASLLRQRRTFLRVDQEGRELRVWLCSQMCVEL